MKKTVHLVLEIVMYSFIVLNLTGCWDNVELNKIAIIMGIGIDKSPGIGNVDMTIQVANTAGIKSSSTDIIGSKNTTAYFNLESKGDTVYDVIKSFSKKASRKLFFAQNQVIIIGKGIAEEGLGKYIDFFFRNRETRRLVWILISDKTASEILNVQSDFENIPSISINELIKQQQFNSEAPMIDLHEFSSRLMSKTTSPIAPIIKVTIEGDKKIAYVSGTAVFKKDKMVGELNKSETRGMLWTLGEVKKGIIVTNAPGTYNKISLETTSSSSKLIPEIKNGKITMKIIIKEDGNLGDQSDSSDLTNLKTLEALEKEKAYVIKSEVMLALKKAQHLDADIFGFGEAIYQKYPERWKYMENNWDETFKDINVDIQVEARLKRPGKITKPII